MARFSQNTIRQVAGFDQEVIAEELLYGVDDYWNVTIRDGTGSNAQPINITNWTFEFRLIRRTITGITDGRNGLELEGLAPAPGATTMNLDTNVKVYNPTAGQLRLLIDDTFFSQLPPIIDTSTPPVYTGYLKATLPATGTPGTVNYIPAQNKKILLLFIVQSDGITAQADA